MGNLHFGYFLSVVQCVRPPFFLSSSKCHDGHRAVGPDQTFPPLEDRSPVNLTSNVSKARTLALYSSVCSLADRGARWLLSSIDPRHNAVRLWEPEHPCEIGIVGIRQRSDRSAAPLEVKRCDLGRGSEAKRGRR